MRVSGSYEGAGWRAALSCSTRRRVAPTWNRHCEETYSDEAIQGNVDYQRYLDCSASLRNDGSRSTQMQHAIEAAPT